MIKKQTIYRYGRNIKSFILNVIFTKWVFVPFVYSFVVILFTYILINQNYDNLRGKIPLFYAYPWGEYQLAPKNYIWLLIYILILIFLINLYLSVRELNVKQNIFISKLYSVGNAIIVSVFAIYISKIVFKSSTIPIIFPQYIKLIVIPLLLGIITTALITPYVINFAKKHGFIDDPLKHKHPAMILTKPVPRAGALAFFLGVLITTFLIVPFYQSQKLIGILLGSLILVLTGLKDDKKDINPYIRLIIQLIAIFIVVLSGIILIYIPNPFGNSITLDNYKYVINYFGEHKVYYYSVIAAVIWIWWTMNFMSFANGVDGVYAGLVTVASLIIAVFMYISLNQDANLAIFTKFAAIIAGAGIGMAIFTWPPQKILWGWGATAAGLMIAALSIIGSTKITITLIVLMIPFLDGIFAIIRRLSRKQMPFFGDREHFHHKLLDDFGWSKRKIASFYWSTTILLGLVGLFTSGKTRAIAFIIIAMVVIVVLGMLNFSFNKNKN